jgi:gliding motility-associated-like protein
LYDSDSVCTDTIHQNVLVDLPPNADFNYTSFIQCSGVSLKLNDLSTGADSTTFFLNFLKVPDGTDSVTLNWSSSYTITLWAYNGECVDSVSLVFNSGNFGDLFHLTMPNIFTPFTTSAVNDLFCPIGLNGEYCYKMHIFNRWGTEIWESEYAEPCWDGLHKDTDARAVDGVYYYVIEFQGGDQAGFLHLISHLD